METTQSREPWNKGKLVGQKPPLKPKDIWAIRIHLHNEHQVRDLALFNLAIDSKLRGCDLVNLRVRDVMHADQIMSRAMVVQRKTQQPVQFELTEPTRAAVSAWIEKANLKAEQYLFPSRLAKSPHISTRQYARIVHQWVAAIGLDTTVYGTQHATDQGDIDLQANQEPEGRPTAAWPYQTRKHRSIPRDRGR